MRPRRPTDALPTDPVYPAIRSIRDLRDPSSTTKHLRAAFDDAGYEWASSHIVGRKTVATEIDEAGLSARQAADQLGPANIITTAQKHYFGRERVVTEGAAVME